MPAPKSLQRPPISLGEYGPAAQTDGIRWPAEWEPHAGCWLAWPSHAEEWNGQLEPPRREVAALCAAIANTNRFRGVSDETADGGRVADQIADQIADQVAETVNVLVRNEETERDARHALANLPVRFHRMDYGDIWLRDTGPIFLHAEGSTFAACFAWNGWGGKYHFPADDDVSVHIAARAGAPFARHNWIVEGGALEHNGQGTLITTRQCLLNHNRNKNLDQADIEARLQSNLAIEHVIWLDRGLHNDHTDGHVDNLARFVDRKTVLCMRAHSGDDPNRDVLQNIFEVLKNAHNTSNEVLEIIEIPSPGRVLDDTGELMPASYANFYIGNQTVAVPVFGTPFDGEAVATIARLFPERCTVGLEARGVLAGGGGFHCITREQPQSPSGDPGHDNSR